MQKRIRNFVLLLTVTIVQIHAQVTNPVKIDFELHPVSPYTTLMAQHDFPNASWYHGFEYGRASIVEDNGSKVLRLKYPQGCLGPNYEEGCAAQVKWNLPEPAKTMWVGYKIKFEEGFDFRKGGKLPGLCGGKAYSGGNKPASKGDGWSARIMWRQDGAIHQYMYYVEQAANYGDYWPWTDESSVSSRFIPGKWHTVITQIILNTIESGATNGNHDGVLRSWLDGEMVLEKTGLRLIDFEDQMIDIFYISTFHGGDNSDWKPLNDSYIRYDDFIVSKNPIEPSSMQTTSYKPANDQTTVIYPCHITQTLIVSSDKNIQSVDIFSATGNHILSSKETSIGLSRLKTGLYIALVIFADGSITQTKFIKSY